jgi:hypothetical protein
MPRSAAPNVTIEDTQARFEEWRRTRQGRAAIPEALWTLAMELARRDGVGRTAATLHLDGMKLKQRMLAAGMIQAKSAPPSFMEFVATREPSNGSGLPECIIELEARQGKMRVHCKGVSVADLATLSRALWDSAH